MAQLSYFERLNLNEDFFYLFRQNFSYRAFSEVAEIYWQKKKNKTEDRIVSHYRSLSCFPD